MHTILGAGGAIGSALAPLLLEHGEEVRLVGRSPAELPGARTKAADLADAAQTLEAVRGSKIVYLLAGLRYSSAVWRATWPAIMENTIAACKAAGARLVFFDNVYMYGPVNGPMTEDSPFAPASRKGSVRAAVALQLLGEMQRGTLEALIARSADFYGPGAEKTGVVNRLVFENLLKEKPAQWIANADVPHSLTYVPDAARALYLLWARDDAFGQTWHLPTHPEPPTGRAFMRLTAQAIGTADRQMVLQKWMMRAFGLVNSDVRESLEMLYQNDRPYVFDSSKFERTFSMPATSYEQGITQTARSYRER